MKKIIKYFIFLYILSISFTSYAYKDNNPYIINSIFSNSNGDNPNEARINTINQARRNALSILFQRLKIDEAYIGDISNNEVSEMVYSQRITNERIAGNNYSAKFNITFSKDYVYGILSKKKY